VSTFIADVNANPVGFSDLADDGYVDRLFVDPDHGRRGIGSALLRHVEAEARRRSIPVLSTHASLVARPVFEASGYTVAYPETVHKDGENLDRFFMTKRLASVGVERVHDEIVCVRR
jgi:putative acetyltransferase